MACKPILVLVNPKSGRGKSTRTLKNLVIPMLEARGLHYEVHVTEFHKRICYILSETNMPSLVGFKSVVVVSGDGLLYETVNAILARSDWAEAIKLPLGIVPTGSGNGMAYTLVRQQQPLLAAGEEALRLCCQQALQDETCESDLVKITYGEGSTIWSFLSLGWGLLSDIDVDSDWLRFLGEFRFTLYGVLRAFTAVSYKGSLSYLPKKTPKDFDSNNSKLDAKEADDNWVHIEDTFACLYAVYQSHISSATNIAPKSTLTDQTIYLTYIQGHLSIVQTIKFLLAIDDGTHDKLPFVKVVPVDKFKFQPLESSKVVVDGDRIPWTLKDGALSAEIVPKLMRLCWSRTLPSNG